jgi:hypothetical protein
MHNSFLHNGAVQIHGKNCKMAEACPEAASVKLTLAHVVFMDVVADAILNTPCREIETWDRAFGFFVGCTVWRAFAARCSGYTRNLTYLKHVDKLNDQIQKAHQNLDALALAENQALDAHNDKAEKEQLGQDSQENVAAPRSPSGSLDLDAIMNQGLALKREAEEQAERDERELTPKPCTTSRVVCRVRKHRDEEKDPLSGREILVDDAISKDLPPPFPVLKRPRLAALFDD